MSSSKDDIVLQQFKAELAKQDESFAWHTLSLYPETISKLPLDDLQWFAAKAAMFAVVFAIEAGRNHPVTEDILKHLVLELKPRCAELKLVYDGDNGAHGVYRNNGMH
ncbi:hypothetical protein [Pseudomonas sp. NMI542_15]|uniref:hypothetical protein n=1 Tax=Pseudomonas sp. NMI542_15 TaxID=2903148 RepID=UPI001E36BB3A|nr:hypothetical protein [Pseudomonas sp. NMI542_15]MCE0782878.1 hypothetical protein [Pseudomonas sp. NMI542_15]